MTHESPLQQKSYKFSLRLIPFCRQIAEHKKEYILTKQLMRSGTSIGANISEASGAQSRADFIAKITVSLKETQESLYWLRLIRDSKLASANTTDPIIDECNQLKYIILASIKTARKNKNQ